MKSVRSKIMREMNSIEMTYFNSGIHVFEGLTELRRPSFIIWKSVDPTKWRVHYEVMAEKRDGFLEYPTIIRCNTREEVEAKKAELIEFGYRRFKVSQIDVYVG